MKKNVPQEIQVAKLSVFDFDINKMILKKIDENNLHAPICILGMPGIADIGKVALDHLVKALEAEKIIDITFSDYPAGAIINDSLLYAPKAEIYFWEDPKKEHDILLVTSDAQPMSPRGIYAISDYLAKLMADFNVTLILALGSYPVEKPNKETNVYITATSGDILERFNKNKKVQVITKGVVIGPNGLVPTLAKRNYNIDGIVLLAETNGYAAMNGDAYDLKASLTLIEVLNRDLTLTMDTNFSPEQIMGMEVKLNNEKETIKKELGINTKSTESASSLEYIC